MLEHHSAGDPFLRSRTVKRELLAELKASWAQGAPVGPEQLLGRWPGDPAADPDVASLLFEDYLQKARHGEPPTVQYYAERFPEHEQSVAGLIRRHDLIRSLGGESSGGGGLRLPAPGERLFGFVLHHELGRGAFARVFLAAQTDLADRPVVLKVSGIEGSEPQTLAQLQHTHIVPIFSLHDDARAGLRALCMPYFGGASLSEVLKALWRNTPRPTAGRELLAALDGVAGPAPARKPSAVAQANGSGVRPLPRSGGEGGQSPRATLGRLDYVQACAWTVARLAEGLQHAHDRGVLHRDVKPSNVLLGADGQPMLLDFNLAQDEHASAAQATLGGTVAYMAPEHLRALASRDPARARAVDQRSDVYSLGMVLYEMLAGQSPFDQSASYCPLPVLIESMAVERGKTVPSIRRLRPDVPWGLESIVRTCLAPDPARRYQQAEELAEDLRRFLSDQPLRYAPELSLAERARKWARRHPRLASSGAVVAAAAVLLLGAGFALSHVRGRLADTAERLGAANADDRKRAYQAGAVRALYLVNTTSDLEDHLRRGLRECEETLGLYGVLQRDDWPEHPDWRRLPEEDRRRLAEDTRELLLLLAGARVRLAPGDRAALREALALLDRAERVPGLPPCRALWLDRAAYSEQLGDGPGAAGARRRAAAVEPDGARDHYLLAMGCARARQFDRAVRHLDRALALNPRHYWAWVQRGLCHQEQGEAALAASDFGACVGLWPEFAWGYFNRGGALAQCGKKAEAVADYTQALRLDPDLLPAYLNRGLLRLEREQYAPALEDLDAARARGRDDAFVHSGRGVALERLGRAEEAERAFRTAERRAAALPQDARLRLRWVYGFAVALRVPDRARAAFEGVLREVPGHPQALYGCGMLAERRGESDEALRYYDLALEAAPGLVEARRFRALVLARRGELAQAEREINLCLEREPRSGATLYAAACVTALAAKHGPPARRLRVAGQAVGLLEQAFARGYGRDKAGADADLDAVRSDPRFRRLLGR